LRYKIEKGLRAVTLKQKNNVSFGLYITAMQKKSNAVDVQ